MIKNKQRLIILAFTMMLTHGIINNLRGQVGPYIINDLKLNYSQLGFLLSFISIGAMSIFFLSGKIIEKYGLYKLLSYGLIHTTAALLSVHYAQNYYSLIFSLFLLGSGLTIINIIAVNITSITYSEKRGKMINLLHLFYGVGGIIAPYFVTFVLKSGFKWSYSFLFSIIFIIFIFFELKKVKIPKIEASSKKLMRTTKDLLTDKKVILFSSIIFLQIGVEFSLVTWLAPFLKDVQGRTDLFISFYLSLFFISFTLGRLAASFIVEKIGYYDFLLISGVISIILISTALIGGPAYTILIPLSGLFLAVQVPTLQALILDTFAESGIKVVGFAQTAGMIGLTVISNWVVGFINDLIGLKAGFSFLVLILIISVILTYYLKKTTKKTLLN